MAKRLIAKFGPVGPSDATTRVYHDDEWQEYVVILRCGNTLKPAADYHTDDRKDALATAQVMLQAPYYCEW